MKNYSVLLIGLLLVSEVTVSDPLSDDDIDRQISAYFSLMPTFIELREKLYSNEETRKKMSDAPVNSGFRTIVELGKDTSTNDYNKLQSSALKYGYESVEAWAFVNDRISTLFGYMANIGQYPSAYGENTGITENTDIFSYISDETKPENVRQDISSRINKICDDYCIEASDLESVGRRYPDLLSAYNEFRNSR